MRASIAGAQMAGIGIYFSQSAMAASFPAFLRIGNTISFNHSGSSRTISVILFTINIFILIKYSLNDFFKVIIKINN